MTQPIQEPSQARQDQAATWGVRQLFRRPAQSNTAAEPWIAIANGATTAADGTWMPIPFSDLIYDPALVTKGDIFDWDTTDLEDTGVYRFELETLVEGWYRYELSTLWDQVTSPGGTDHGYAVQRITFSSTTGFTFDEDDIRDSADWLDNNYAVGFEMLDNPWLHTYGRALVPGGRIWRPRAKQLTGASRGLSGTFFRLWYIKSENPANFVWETVGT